MFIIKLIVSKYGYEKTVEEIMGYEIDEAVAKEYCIRTNANLAYDKSNGIAYYNYTKVDKLSEDNISIKVPVDKKSIIDAKVESMSIEELFNLLDN